MGDNACTINRNDEASPVSHGEPSPLFSADQPPNEALMGDERMLREDGAGAQEKRDGARRTDGEPIEESRNSGTPRILLLSESLEKVLNFSNEVEKSHRILGGFSQNFVTFRMGETAERITLSVTHTLDEVDGNIDSTSGRAFK